jgi:hypothetical protein
MSGCALHHARIPGVVFSETGVLLHGHRLKLHLSAPAARPGVIVVYATGDAGWWGKDRAIFTHLCAMGYPVVGFSSREYVHHMGERDPAGRAQIAEDVAAIIRTAQTALGLPTTTSAILVGKSRGAGLAVAAAGRPALAGRLEGLVAIGLTREEEHVRARRFRLRRHSGTQSDAPMLDTYAALRAIDAIRVAVIQSTNDEYIGAAAARELFGPDTASRQFYAIAARDHNFSGATDSMYRKMEQVLQWMAGK